MGYFCIQWVFVVQPNIEHETDGDGELIELESSASSMGFQPNPEIEE